MKLNRIEEWIGLWLIIALVNRETTPERLEKMVIAAQAAIIRKHHAGGKQ